MMDIRKFMKATSRDDDQDHHGLEDREETTSEVGSRDSDGPSEPKEKRQKTRHVELLEDSVTDDSDRQIGHSDQEKETDLADITDILGEERDGEEIASTSRPTSGHVVRGPADLSQFTDSGPTQPGLNDTFRFPKSHGRKFKSDWYKTFPWLEYSATTDKVYCFVCRHFSTGKKRY